MALAKTTLASACAAGDYQIVVASATSVAAGRVIRIDNEIMKVRSDYSSGVTVSVVRGLNGSAVVAHPVTANVVHGLASDFSASGAPGDDSGVLYPARRVRQLASYSAAGAITLPTPGNDMVAIINGTNALAMTIANPGKDQDGDMLIVVGNGKAAHTITYTAGLGDGGSGLDVGTFDTGAQCAEQFIAANEIWVPLPSPRAGTLTGCDISYA
jgi:hypothetical protein